MTLRQVGKCFSCRRSGPLASKRRQIEIVQHRDEGLDAAGIGRIGVEYLTALAQEDADAVMLAIGKPGFAVLQMLGAGAVIIFGRCYLLIRGDVEIIVEVAAE